MIKSTSNDYSNSIQSFWFKLPVYIMSFAFVLTYDLTNDALWLVLLQGVWLNLNTITYLIYSLFVSAVECNIIAPDKDEDYFLRRFHRILRLNRVNHWAKVTAILVLFAFFNLLFPLTFISLALASLDVKTQGKRHMFVRIASIGLELFTFCILIPGIIYNDHTNLFTSMVLLLRVWFSLLRLAHAFRMPNIAIYLNPFTVVASPLLLVFSMSLTIEKTRNQRFIGDNNSGKFHHHRLLHFYMIVVDQNLDIQSFQKDDIYELDRSDSTQSNTESDTGCENCDRTMNVFAICDVKRMDFFKKLNKDWYDSNAKNVRYH